MKTTQRATQRSGWKICSSKYTIFAVHSLIPVKKKLKEDMVMTKESGDVDTHTHTHADFQ